jgi:hypothetical protein
LCIGDPIFIEVVTGYLFTTLLIDQLITVVVDTIATDF